MKLPDCLMHGDQEVSTKELARVIGVRRLNRVNRRRDQTQRLSGRRYRLGVRRKMPVYMEATILELPKVYINGGKEVFGGNEPARFNKAIRTETGESGDLKDYSKPIFNGSLTAVVLPYPHRRHYYRQWIIKDLMKLGFDLQTF